MNRLILFSLLCSLLWTSCRSFPYNTPEARAARRAARTQMSSPKAEAATSAKDSLQRAATPAPTTTGGRRPSAPRTTDSLPVGLADTLTPQPWTPNPLLADIQPFIKALDSLPDTLRAKLERKVALEEVRTTQVRFAKDSLTAPVKYSGEDSMIYDLNDRKIYLYGDAKVNYTTSKLEAEHIVFDFSTNIATAYGLFNDSLNRYEILPKYKDGDQEFESERIEYNFKTKKGKVYQTSTKQGDGYFLSESTKYVGKDPASDRKDDVIYSGNAIYTTCNHKHPHFGLRSAKAKVIPNKMIVVGPTYLEVMGVPTPIGLPFGFFPITEGRSSGLILSTEFEQSPRYGLGLLGMGYYLGMSDNWDLALTTDIYIRGSLRFNARARYAKRYKHRGNVNLLFSNLISDERGTPDYSVLRDFRIDWSHQQDNKAHPYQSFNASVRFGTGTSLRRNQNDASAVLENTLNSNISFTRRFPNSPFTLTLGASHSQNTNTNVMNITLPQVGLNMNQIFPLKRKNPTDGERWYERLTFSYSMNMANQITTTDTALFAADGLTNALKDAKYGIQHSPRIGISLKAFKYLNIQPTINYNERWYFYSNEQRFDPTLVIAEPDTLRDTEGNITSIERDTTFGTVIREREAGFYPVREFSAGLSLNTTLYGMLTPKIFGLYQIRNVMNPSLSFNWRPDYGKANWDYYRQVQTDTRYPDRYDTYSRFGENIYGAPGIGEQAAISYGLTNRTEAKVRNRQDTTGKNPFRKVPIFNNLSLNGSYNIAADSLKWSVIRLNGNTKLFKHITLTFGMIFDPYTADLNTNTRLNTLEWGKNGRLARLTSYNLALTTSITNSKLREWLGLGPAPRNQAESFNLIENINVNYTLRANNRYQDGRDTTIFTANEIALNGNFKLSKGWGVRVGRIGYDLSKRRLTYPDLTFTRDLHCWEMGLSWQPERRTWSFYLRVRPSSLGFIELPVRKEFYDAF